MESIKRKYFCFNMIFREFFNSFDFTLGRFPPLNFSTIIVLREVEASSRPKAGGESRGGKIGFLSRLWAI